MEKIELALTVVVQTLCGLAAAGFVVAVITQPYL